MKPIVRNAADEEQVKEARLKEKFGRERELEDMRSVLASHRGRRLIWRYLEECGVFKISFTGSSETFFKEGKRDIGLRLLADINDAAPEAYSIMLREAKGEENVS